MGCSTRRIAEGEASGVMTAFNFIDPRASSLLIADLEKMLSRDPDARRLVREHRRYQVLLVLLRPR